MKFLVDENLPSSLCRWLVDEGHQAEHAPRVVVLRIGSMASSAVIAACRQAWPDVLLALEAGEVAVEVWR